MDPTNPDPEHCEEHCAAFYLCTYVSLPKASSFTRVPPVTPWSASDGGLRFCRIASDTSKRKKLLLKHAHELFAMNLLSELEY